MQGKFDEMNGLSRTLLSEARLWKPVKSIIFDAPQQKGGLLARLDMAKRAVEGVCQYAQVLDHDVCTGHAHVYKVRTQCGAVWCSVVQCGAVWCRVVQCGAVWCIVVQCVAVWCSVVQRGVVWRSVVQCGAVWCSVVQCALQSITVCCSMMQALSRLQGAHT